MGHDDDKPSNTPCSKCMDLWLTVLIKAPALVCIVQLAICATLSTIGIMNSMNAYGVPFKVDLDFGNYLGATTELFMLNKAHGVAQKNQTDSLIKATTKRRLWDHAVSESYNYTNLDMNMENIDPSLESPSLESIDRTERNLASIPCTKTMGGKGQCVQSVWHWSLNLYYRPKIPCQKNEACMFAEEILNEIKIFETALTSVTMNGGQDTKGNDIIVGYDDFCLKSSKIFADGAPWSCRPIDTINMVFYAEQEDNVLWFNGKANTIRKKKDAVKDLVVRTPLHWLTDKYFSPLNQSDPGVLRSRMVGGLPLKGYQDVNDDRPGQILVERKYLKKILDDVLLKANANFTYLNVNWEETTIGLTSIEVMQELQHDAVYALGSFIFVLALMFLHTMSLTLTIMSTIGILLSFPMAFACYWWCGFRTMKLLNFVSLFLIMGIGADDVFVFYDTFHQGKAVKGEFSRISTRFRWAYKHAGGAMLVTTVTTCGSFFANAVSEVAVVKEFGVFMGFVVMWNYINVMTLFPAALLMNEYMMDRCCAKDLTAADTAETAVVPFDSTVADATGTAETATATPVPKKRKGRRRSLKKGQTILNTSGKVEIKSLSMIERCFNGCFTDVIWKLRWLWLIIGFLMAAVGTWAGFTFFVPLKGQPQIFLKERNQGGLDDYKYNYFKTMNDDVIHFDLEAAIQKDSSYMSAADEAEANANKYQTMAQMSCDFNLGLDSDGDDTNLGQTFVIDDIGTIEKLVSINNNLGNATGKWSATIDSSWVTLSPGSGGTTITGETKAGSVSNIRLVYAVSDTTMARGDKEELSLTITDTVNNRIICQSGSTTNGVEMKKYVATRRLQKPTMKSIDAVLNIGDSDSLTMIPSFDPDIKSYDIKTKEKEDASIYFKLVMDTTPECGDACKYDEINIKRCYELTATGCKERTVRYKPDTEHTDVIELLGNLVDGELLKTTETKVTLELIYYVHNKDGKRNNDIKNTFTFNIKREVPAAKPDEKPTKLSLTALPKDAGIQVVFQPIMFADQNLGIDVMDEDVTSYVFTFYKGTDEVKPSFERAVTSIDYDSDTELCTAIFKMTDAGDYSVQIKAKNLKGEGPPSTESKTSSDKSFYTLFWTPDCPANVCSAKKPIIDAKPTVVVNADLTATVSISSDAINLGSSTPLSSVICTTTPDNIVGTSLDFKSGTSFNGYKIDLKELDPVKTYTVTCVLTDASKTSSIPSIASDSFSSVTKPVGKPALTGMVVTADGITVTFVPILAELTTASGKISILSNTVTSYVFNFAGLSPSPINEQIELITANDLTCEKDATFKVLCTTKNPIKLTKYANDLSLIVKGKNVKGESGGSIESTNPGKAPWFQIKWLENCPIETCHSILPVLAKPQVVVDKDLTAIVFFGQGSTIGSATPLGPVSCKTTPGDFSGVGDLDGVLIIGTLDASLTYTITCTVTDAGGATSLDVESDVFAAAIKPTKKPTLLSMIATTTGMNIGFAPIMTTDTPSVMDPSITKYVLTFTDGASAEVDVGTAEKKNALCVKEDIGNMVCSVIMEPSAAGSYGVTVAAKNAAGTGPASTESTSAGLSPWPLLIWETNCPANTCSSILPSVKTAPLVWCDAENKITVVISKDNLGVGSAIPYGKMTCEAKKATGADTTKFVATNSGDYLKTATFTGFYITLDGSSTCVPASANAACSSIAAPANQAACDLQNVGTCAGGGGAECTSVNNGPEVTCIGTNDDGGNACVWTSINHCSYSAPSLEATLKYKVKCRMVDAALLSSADSTSSVEIQPTTKPPAPIHVETINTAIVSNKYNADIKVNGLTSRGDLQSTTKTKIKCNKKDSTEFVVETVLSENDAQTVTIIDLDEDVSYTFTCIATNENGDVSTISEDIVVEQSSTASKIKPEKPTISSVTRESNGDVTVVVTPDSGTTETDVTKYTCTATNKCSVSSSTVSAFIGLSNEAHTSKTVTFSGATSALSSGVEYSITCTTQTNLISDASSADTLRANAAVVELLPTDAPTVTAGVSETLSVVWTAPAETGFKCSLFKGIDRDTPEDTKSPDTTSTPMSFTGLTNGDTYTVVCYIDATDKSCYGTETKDTQVFAPLVAPSIESVVSNAADREVTITLASSPPSVSGLVTKYECKSDSGTYKGSWQDSAPKNVVLSTSINSGAQTFVCRSTNSLGVSPDSAGKTETVVFHPSEPISVSVARKTNDPTGLTVTWQASSDSGGSSINKYKCQAFDKDKTDTAQKESVTADGTTLTLDLTGLVSGNVYDIYCWASNDGTNYGKKSDKFTSPMVGTIPTTPSTKDLAKVIGERTVELTLTVVADSVPAVTTYTCTAAPTNAAKLNVVATGDVVTGENTIRISNLEGGEIYSVTCITTSVLGDSLGTTALSITPLFKPDTPTIGTVSVTSTTSLSVIVVAPSDKGGGDIDAYKCVGQSGSLASIESVVSTAAVTADQTSMTVALNNLVAGNKYSITCQVQNNDEWSDASDASVNNWVGAIPGIPLLASSSSVEVDDKSGDVTVRLQLVTAVPKVTQYECEVVMADSSKQDHGEKAVSIELTETELNEGSDVSPVIVFKMGDGSGVDTETDLIMGETFQFKCRSTNQIGTSGFSAETLAVTPVAQPGPPTLSNGVDVDITRPTTTSLSIALTTGTNGGGTISKYECVATNSGDAADFKTASSDSPTVTMWELTAGQSYTIKCRNENEKDWSDYLELDKAIYAGALPVAPTFNNIGTNKDMPTYDAAGVITITLDTISSTPPVTEYSCTIENGPDKDNAAKKTSTSSTNIITFDTLQHGLSSFKCFAKSLLGNSIDSSTSESVDKAIKPQAPTVNGGSITRPTTTSLSIVVTPPSDTGGKPITTTTCVATEADDSLKTTNGDSASSTIIINSLTAGKAYNIECTVTNVEGESPSSTKIENIWTGSLPTPPTHSNQGTDGTNAPTYTAANAGKVTATLEAVSSIPAVTSYECIVVSGPEKDVTATSIDATAVVIFNGISSQPAKSTFKCRSINPIGASLTWSDVTTEISPKGYPGPPTNVRTETDPLTKDGTKLRVTFDKPNADGGSTILKYKCTVDSDASKTMETLNEVIGAGLLFENLTPNVKVNIKCFTITSEGESQNVGTEGMPPSTDASIPYSIPKAPKSVTAARSADKTLTVTIVPSDADQTLGLRLKYKCWSVLDETNYGESSFGQTKIYLTNLESGKSHEIKCNVQNDKIGSKSTTTSTTTNVLVKELPPAPTFVDIVPDNGQITLNVNNNGINTVDATKYFVPSKIHCWDFKKTSTKETNGVKVDYLTLKQNVVMTELTNGKEYTFQCLFTTEIGDTVVSLESVKATPGKKMESCMEVDTENGLTLEQLRKQIADQLGVDISQVILEEDTSCGGGRRRRLAHLLNKKNNNENKKNKNKERRKLIDLSKYKVTIVLGDTSTALETGKKLEDSCVNLNLGDGCKSERGSISLDGFDDATIKTLKINAIDVNGKEEIFTFTPPFKPDLLGPYTVVVSDENYNIEMVLNSISVQQDSTTGGLSNDVKISTQLSSSKQWMSEIIPTTKTSPSFISETDTLEDGTKKKVQRCKITTKQKIKQDEKEDKKWIKYSKIEITSPDGSSTKKYELNIQYNGKDCRIDEETKQPMENNCNQIVAPNHLSGIGQQAAPNNKGGECNRMTGLCECENNWFESSTGCDRYCPRSDGMTCGYNGVCNSTSKVCDCDETYMGAGCQDRKCPVCNNGATCLMNQKDSRKDYTCSNDCNKGWGGKQCDTKICPNKCSKHLDEANKCVEATGTCVCAPGYAGNGTSRIENDCANKLPERTPLSSSIEIALTWGLKNYKKIYNEKGEIEVVPVYDTPDQFHLNRRHMNHMLALCKKVRSLPNLMVRSDQPCWVERFFESNWTTTANGMPTNGGNTIDTDKHWTNALTTFFQAKHMKTDLETGNEGTSKKQYWNFQNDIVTDKFEYGGTVNMVSVRLRIQVAETIAARALKPNYTHWFNFVKEWNEEYSDLTKDETKSIDTIYEFGEMKMISSAFTRMDTELKIVRSTLDSWILSNIICLISVLLFTQNILISIYTMLAIFLIVASLMGVIFGIAQYPFGAIEAVGITIFVGLSVDYCLHTAHGYSGSTFDTRQLRVQDMLTKLGISIAGAAVTTAGSCIFLFFCHIFLFLQLGVMLFANCLIAVVFSLFFLSALMMIAGPLGRCGEIGYTLTCGCCRKKESDGSTSITAVVPLQSVMAMPVQQNMGNGFIPNSLQGGEGEGEQKGEGKGEVVESWDI